MENEEKKHLILKIYGKGSSFYRLNLKQHTKGYRFSFQDLVIYEGKDYPSNPLFYDKFNKWKEVTFEDALLNRVPDNTFYRRAIVSKLEKGFYELYKTYTSRSSAEIKSFVRCVLQLALEHGFDGTIITTSELHLSLANVKPAAAKLALRKLHDLGIIIYMLGHSMPKTQSRKAMPPAFMLHPQHEGHILDMLKDLETGKIKLKDIKGE